MEIQRGDQMRSSCSFDKNELVTKRMGWDNQVHTWSHGDHRITGQRQGGQQQEPQQLGTQRVRVVVAIKARETAPVKKPIEYEQRSELSCELSRVRSCKSCVNWWRSRSPETIHSSIKNATQMYQRVWDSSELGTAILSTSIQIPIDAGVGNPQFMFSRSRSEFVVD